jgi:hypothetical protein
VPPASGGTHARHVVVACKQTELGKENEKHQSIGGIPQRAHGDKQLPEIDRGWMEFCARRRHARDGRILQSAWREIAGPV